MRWFGKTAEKGGWQRQQEISPRKNSMSFNEGKNEKVSA
jgi:hypothetical protein